MQKATVVVTLNQVFEGKETIRRILSTPLEVKLAYRMNKIATVLLRKLKEIEKIRVDLVDKYGKEDDKGRTSVPPENIKAFTEEFERELDKEIDLEVQPIPFSCLKSISISAADLVAIQPFIEEPTQEELK